MSANAASKNTMSESEAVERAWELAKKIRVAMLTTWDGQQQCSRPMSSHVFRDRCAIYFLDKANSAKEEQIKQFPTIGLSYIDGMGNKYLNFSGQAVVSNDRALIKELWSDFYKAWWESENDPSIRVITFTPEKAELWDGVNDLVASAKMLLAAVTGAKPDFGDSKKVAI